MEINTLTWIAIPLIGGVIGYITNRIAVAMIFRPVRPVNVLGFRIQGLMPRRQRDLANSIGNVVGNHLVHHDDIVRSLQKVDLERFLADVLERGLAPKIESLRSLPLIGGFLTAQRVGELKESLVQGILSQREAIYEKLQEAIEQGLDVQQIVADKVAAFPIPKLEKLVLEVASRELRSIEVLGGVLGVIIGIGQVVLIWAIG